MNGLNTVWPGLKFVHLQILNMDLRDSQCGMRDVTTSILLLMIWALFWYLFLGDFLFFVFVFGLKCIGNILFLFQDLSRWIPSFYFQHVMSFCPDISHNVSTNNSPIKETNTLADVIWPSGLGWRCNNIQQIRWPPGHVHGGRTCKKNFAASSDFL